MEFADALSARRSCRAYDRRTISSPVLERVLSAAVRAPSAGNAWGLDLVVLDDRAALDDYWAVALPAGPKRDRFPWPGLLDAPVLVVPVVEPDAYVRRYREDDKVSSGLGSGSDAWAVPYWWVDGGAAVMAVLLAATAEGLGSLLFGLFDREAEVGAHLGIPADRRPVGVIALGHADRGRDRSSASAKRGRPTPAAIIHRQGW